MKLNKTYNPKEYEDSIYQQWEESDAFAPKDRGTGQNYSIVIPPPNANGNLHLGHGLTMNIEDILIRYHRMKGDKTLFLPGADHAGFETQVVYEKKLIAEGKSRFDFTREQLYKNIWDFVAENRDNYESQFRKLGASLDWKHYTYTLDDKIVKSAFATFKKMWDEGLIYRGERLVNFCTFHGTGFADIEVEHKESKGHLWYIKYPLTDGSGELTVATTRPETMLGDTAVAINPKDERYTKFLGKTVKLPITNREVPIITDEFVDSAFGTGAVKITPAHDPNDYEAALRHDLPMITVINHEGKLTHDVPEQFRGLEVSQARKAVIEELKNQGLLEKTEDHTNSVGHCYKCGTVIQPLLRKQWFIDMKPLTKMAIAELEKGSIDFQPIAKKKQLITYLQGLRDWNISRQIAWGIPIPAFVNVDDGDDWIYNEQTDKEFLEIDGKTYHRDPDVFDTWFSSSSWPYATLDYPDGDDYKDFYPLSLMETGADILYPWVSRMIMFGLYTTGKVPFDSVYLHGLILDEHGAKMSKSKGNVVDPMDKIDTYGSDAFRMGIITGQSAGNNQSYDEAKIIAGRNFANKLWNVARFIQDKIESLDVGVSPEPKTYADEWLLVKLQQSTKTITSLLEKNKISEAYENLYHLLWDDFADWYIEASKVSLNKSVLSYGLETILKLAHPFAPFVTEAIWNSMGSGNDEMLIVSLWPKEVTGDKKLASEFDKLIAIVSEIRLLSATTGVLKPVLITNDEFVEANIELVSRLANLAEVKIADQANGIKLTSTANNCWIEIDESTQKRLVSKLASQISDTQKTITGLQSRLNNKSYTQKAPEKLVNETKEQLASAKLLLEKKLIELERIKERK